MTFLLLPHFGWNRQCWSEHSMQIFSGYVFISLGTYLGEVILYLTIWGTVTAFQKHLCHFPFLLAVNEGSSFSISSTLALSFCYFFVITILVGLKWYLMLLVCVFLMASDVEHLFMRLFAFFFFSLGLCPWHMEVPKLGVQSELQLPAYVTATAAPDPSQVFDLHHSSQQHRILNLLRPGIEPTASWLLVRFNSSAPRTPMRLFVLFFWKMFIQAFLPIFN